MEEINLKELFSYMLSKLYIILFVAVVLVLGSIIYREQFKTPMYESYTTVVLARSNNVIDDEDLSVGITQNDILLNQKLVATYREIIKSRRILDQVIEDLDLDMTYSELRGKVTVVNEADTELIRISVVDDDSEDAKNIADSIARVFSNEITKIYSIKNISVIDYAREELKPYNINPLKETVIAMLIGIVLGCGIVFVMFYFDTTIKSVDEVEKKLKLPILGSVPKTGNYRGGNK